MTNALDGLLDVLLTNEERYNSILGWLLDPDPTNARTPGQPTIEFDHGLGSEFLIRFLSLADARTPQRWRELVERADPLSVEPDIRVRQVDEETGETTTRAPDFGITLGRHKVVVEVKIEDGAIYGARDQLAFAYEDLPSRDDAPETLGLVLPTAPTRSPAV